MLSDPDFDRINEVGESFPAEKEDISRRPIDVVDVVDVGLLGSDEGTNPPPARVEGLAKVDVDVGDLIVLEKG